MSSITKKKVGKLSGPPSAKAVARLPSSIANIFNIFFIFCYHLVYSYLLIHALNKYQRHHFRPCVTARQTSRLSGGCYDDNMILIGAIDFNWLLGKFLVIFVPYFVYAFNYIKIIIIMKNLTSKKLCEIYTV